VLATEPLRSHPGTSLAVFLVDPHLALLVEVVSGHRFRRLPRATIFVSARGMTTPESRELRFEQSTAGHSWYCRTRRSVSLPRRRSAREPLQDAHRRCCRRGVTLSRHGHYLLFCPCCATRRARRWPVLGPQDGRSDECHHLARCGRAREFAPHLRLLQVGFDGRDSSTFAVGLGPTGTQSVGRWASTCGGGLASTIFGSTRRAMIVIS